jgi:muramoyltetrapeptide carboxypeptidase
VKDLRRPARLAPGARVAVVAPSGPVAEERLQAGLDLLRGWDLDPVVAPHVLDRHSALGHLAGTDADRAADLQRAWCDRTVDAVLCARGGYGAQRIVDLLDWEAMRAAGPKVFVGFSDATTLHEAFAVRLGLVTLYGPVAAGVDFIKNARAQEHLKATLFAPETVRTLTSTGTALAPGRARGVTLGGCLALLATGYGTPAPAPAAGCSCSRTWGSGRTASTGRSPSSCAPGGSTASRASRSAPGTGAGPTRSCARCSPTGSAGSVCPWSRSSASGTAKGR